MNRKLLWIGGIVVGIILAVVIVLSMVVKNYLRSDRLKALIVPKLEEFTGRKTGIDLISVSLFRGITVKGISLMERDGKQEFVKAKEFVIEYRLLPLLEKKLVISRVELISPTIRLVRGMDGRFNFSDIIEMSRAGKKEEGPGTSGEHGLPLMVETDKISVRDARVTFTDEESGFPAMDMVSDIELKLSVEKGRTVPEVSGKVNIKELTMKGAGGEVKGTGTVSLEKDAIGFNITAAVGKDALKISGDVKDYSKDPEARIDINSAELDLEKLMAFSEGKKEAKKPQAVKRIASAQKETGKGKVKQEGKEEKAAGLTASGELKVGAAKYKGYVLRDFTARYNYTGGNFTINPVSAGLSGEKGMTLQGTAKGELRGSTTARASAAESLKSTLSGKFSADLSRCEMKESKIGEAIALFTGIREIASPKFDAVHFLFTIANEKIVLNGAMTSNLMTLNPSGSVGFDKRMDVIAELRVAPGLTGRISSGQFGRYVKDEKGWTVLPLRITGTTDKPSVGLNQAAIGRQLQKGATQEIEKRLFKGILGR